MIKQANSKEIMDNLQKKEEKVLDISFSSQSKKYTNNDHRSSLTNGFTKNRVFIRWLYVVCMGWAFKM